MLQNQVIDTVKSCNALQRWCTLKEPTVSVGSVNQPFGSFRDFFLLASQHAEKTRRCKPHIDGIICEELSQCRIRSDGKLLRALSSRSTRLSSLIPKSVEAKAAKDPNYITFPLIFTNNCKNGEV
eukprot:1791187-Rhodomonas_salina.1